MAVLSTPGKECALGAVACDGGVNFSVFVADPGPVTLLLENDGEILRVPMPRKESIASVWVEGLEPGQAYAFEFDDRHLLDPYAKALSTGRDWGEPVDTVFCVVTEDLARAQSTLRVEDLVIYEMHVRGFTRSATSRVHAPGTFTGAIERLDALVELGVNAVELLPITEFFETECHPHNYWGYSPVSFFVPMGRYAAGRDLDAPIREFRAFVDACHERGIVVLLDLVFNHTAERDVNCPTYSYRGLASDVYYLKTLDGQLVNDSGCGNTFNVNHPVTQDLLLASLHWWKQVVGVDGFRFDLAAAFFRGPGGLPLDSSRFIEAVEKDASLKDCYLIAEPWDASGLQLGGRFAQQNSRWLEWNDRFRDDVRRFLRGEPTADSLATRLAGSQDRFAAATPSCSVNFICAHDGYSLGDLVSYEQKHNWANLEENRDGHDNNISWNCGCEGPSDDATIVALRERQMRSALLLLLCARGTPMLHMGDEYGRSKGGNNNTWCQDEPISWLDWDAWERSALRAFTQKLLRIRKDNSLLGKDQFLTEDSVTWRDPNGQVHQWTEHTQFLGMHLHEDGEELYLIAYNSDEETMATLPDGQWELLISSANEHEEGCIGDTLPIRRCVILLKRIDQ